MKPGSAALAAAVACLLGVGTAASAEETKVPVFEDYVLNCSACHGLDGDGTPGVTPSLHGLASLLDAPGGRAYLGRVPGVAQAPLSDERLARVLNWVLERYSGRAAEPPYSAAEMGRLRKSPIRDTVSARAALAL